MRKIGLLKKILLEQYKEYWKQLQTKGPNEKAARTLTPRDGM